MNKIVKILTIGIVSLNLSYADYALLMNDLFGEVKSEIAKMESGDRYDAVNKNGFLGKYQFGAMSLVDLGIINREKYKSQTYTMPTQTRKAKVMWRNGQTLNSFVNNPSNWNIVGGKEAFLGTKSIQEDAMNNMLMRNYRALASRGFDMSDRNRAKSLLKAAHFGGVSSAINYAQSNIDYKDAFGTSISKYYGESQPNRDDKLNRDDKPNKKVVFKFND